MTLSEWKNDFKGFVKSLSMPRDDYKGIMEYIDEVPEPHWIPVTERPPETTGEYLVTKREMYTHRLIIDIAMYFVNDGWHKADPVIAWMPKPEPYKGVTE